MSSNREPMWYCHECNSEMRPLMVPDPHCASCNGTFVEMMENPTDDPRDFHHTHAGLDDDLNAGPNPFMIGLSEMLRGTGGGGGGGGGGGFTLQINGSQAAAGNGRTFLLGRTTGGSPERVTPLSEFLRGGAGSPTGAERTPGGAPTIQDRQMMIGQLLSALQRNTDRRQGFDPFAELLGMRPPGGPDSGRWGDYVHNQEALDQIITQLMETNSHTPVPATEEIMNKLPKEVLEEGSPLLQKDCAICKDQFSTHAEEPDEHIVVTLPCKHPYHKSCILPWLQSNGTCPVCRYQLVPQPGQEPSPAPPISPASPVSPPSPTSPTSGTSAQQRSPRPAGQNSPGGMFNNLFSYIGGGSGSRSGNSRNQNQSSGNRRGPPGGWGEELD